MKELNNHIKTRNFARAYLFYGAEAFLLTHWRYALVSAILPPDARDMNMEVFEGKVPAPDIIAAAETLPFLAGHRLVVVKDSGLFAAGRADDSAEMADYVKNIPDTSILVFIEAEIDKRGRLYKRLNETGLVLEAKPPKEAELINWAVKLAAKKGAVLQRTAASRLVRNSSGDMQNLSNEIEKLVTYKAGGEIDAEDIDLMCAKSLEAKIFDLMRAIGDVDVKRATTLYANLIATKESPLMILAMIARQFRFCLQCGALSKHASQKDIAAQLKLHPFAVREFIETSQNFTEAAMIAALENCLETDFAIKTGQIGDEAGVELLVVKCCDSPAV